MSDIKPTYTIAYYSKSLTHNVMRGTPSPALLTKHVDNGADVIGCITIPEARALIAAARAEGFAAGIRAAAEGMRGLAAEWSAEAKRLAALPVPVGDDWKNKHIYRADALSQCASQLLALPTPDAPETGNG